MWKFRGKPGKSACIFVEYLWKKLLVSFLQKSVDKAKVVW